jgi:hypothetical protein
MSNIMAITYEGAAAVTQSDATADPAGPFAAFYVGTTGGNVKVTTIDGSTVTLAGTLIGQIYPIAITRVWSTGTAASNILGLRALPYKPSVKGT